MVIAILIFACLQVGGMFVQAIKSTRMPREDLAIFTATIVLAVAWRYLT